MLASSAVMPVTPQSDLHDLFKALFDGAGLRRFIHFLDPKLSGELPGAGVSLSELAFATVELLRRHGYIDEALFERLRIDFSRRAAEIDRVATRFGFASPVGEALSKCDLVAGEMSRSVEDPRAASKPRETVRGQQDPFQRAATTRSGLPTVSVTQKVVDYAHKTGRLGSQQIVIRGTPGGNKSAPIDLRLAIGGATYTLTVADSHAIWRSHQSGSSECHFDSLYRLLSVQPGNEVVVDEAEVLDVVDGAVERDKKLRDSGTLRQLLAAKVRRSGDGGPVGWLYPLRQGAMRWEFWLLAVGCGVGAVAGMHSLAKSEPQIQDAGASELAGAEPASRTVEFPDTLSESVSDETLVNKLKGGGKVCSFSDLPARPTKPNPNIQAPPTGRSCGVVETALANTDAPMSLIGLTGGEFAMGSPKSESGRSENEGPQHRVALSRFAICETEVSVRQYELVTGEKPSACSFGCANDQPVQNVSWEDSVKFLNALTRVENKRRGSGEQLTKCYDEQTWAWEAGCTGYRLPTEAEWEYAARAGSTTAFHFGEKEANICDYANYRNASFSGDGHERATCDDGFKNLAPVKTERLKPNAWGLHGVHGNVWEWVYDWHDDSFYEQSQKKDVNPTNKNRASFRVLRGGSFNDRPAFARSAVRYRYSPENRYRYVGLRCVRGPSPQH